VESALRKWLKKNKFLKDGFQKLVQRWQKCIEVRGDFMDKYLCSFENNLCTHISFW
jgi:hypothetical protein